jgi:hypothetical protein
MFAQIEIGRSGRAALVDPVSFYVANANRLFAYLLVAWLISIIRAMYHRENEMARVDYLTGIPNKLGFDEQLRIEMARHRHLSRYAGEHRSRSVVFRQRDVPGEDFRQEPCAAPHLYDGIERRAGRAVGTAARAALIPAHPLCLPPFLVRRGRPRIP